MDLSAALDLAHYGVKGMRKGKRRWTNPDDTLTLAGRLHYGLAGETAKTGSIKRAEKAPPQKVLTEQRLTEQRSQPKPVYGESYAVLHPKSTGILGSTTVDINKATNLSDLSKGKLDKSVTKLNKDSEVAELDQTYDARQKELAKAGIPVTAQRSQPKSEIGASSTTLKPTTLLGEWTDILSEQDKKMKLSEIRKKRAKTAAKKKIQSFHGN